TKAVAFDQYPSFQRYVAERTIAVVPVQPVVVERRTIHDARAVVAGDKVAFEISKYIEVQVAVLIIIQEGGILTVPRVCHTIRFCLIHKFRHAILIHAFVDEQSIGPRKRIVADSGADIDIEKSILIYVCECHTGVPLAIARDSRFFRYIFESKVAAIKVKSVWHHVAAEKDVGETIVIEIAHCHTCTVVHILYGEDVDRVSFQYCVFKIDTRFGRWHEPEQRLSSIRAGAGCDDRGEEENIKPKSHRAWH